MDLLQLGRSQLVRAPLERLELIFQLQFLQKPEDAVASGLFEPASRVRVDLEPNETDSPVEGNFCSFVVISHDGRSV